MEKKHSVSIEKLKIYTKKANHQFYCVMEEESLIMPAQSAYCYIVTYQIEIFKLGEE